MTIDWITVVFKVLMYTKNPNCLLRFLLLNKNYNIFKNNSELLHLKELCQETFESVFFKIFKQVLLIIAPRPSLRTVWEPLALDK